MKRDHRSLDQRFHSFTLVINLINLYIQEMMPPTQVVEIPHTWLASTGCNGQDILSQNPITLLTKTYNKYTCKLQ